MVIQGQINQRKAVFAIFAYNDVGNLVGDCFLLYVFREVMRQSGSRNLVVQRHLHYILIVGLTLI